MFREELNTPKYTCSVTSITENALGVNPGMWIIYVKKKNALYQYFPTTHPKIPTIFVMNGWTVVSHLNMCSLE